MPAKAAVILDVDGTLIDSNGSHARAWVDAFAEHGIAVAFENVRRSIGMGGDKLLPAVAGIEESSDLGAQIASRRGEIFRSRYLPALRPFPRTRALIERFAADDFTLVVASSAKEDELGPLLERAGVADLLPKRTSSDDAEHSKPDPDIVTAALRKGGCEPARSIMLGDTAYDVAAAKRAGIQIVALESGGWTREALAGAAAVYRDPADLLDHYGESPFGQLMATADVANSRRPTGSSA